MNIKNFVFTALNYALQKYPVRIMDSIHSIQYVKENGVSLSRFGEGEIELMDKHRNLKFQRYDEKLAMRMKEVLQSHDPKIAIAIPLALQNRTGLNARANGFWASHASYAMVNWVKYLGIGRTYLDSLMTRCYIDLVDKSQTVALYDAWRSIWKGKNLLIVEGEQSRLGVGNDLFSGAKQIQRILCPSENAFDQYDEILEAACSSRKDVLILLALGPTASVLAFDLGKRGYQALDVGHIDIEYEWFLMGANEPIQVTGKYTNEAKDGKCMSDLYDADYQKQIIKIIR